MTSNASTLRAERPSSSVEPHDAYGSRLELAGAGGACGSSPSSSLAAPLLLLVAVAAERALLVGLAEAEDFAEGIMLDMVFWCVW